MTTEGSFGSLLIHTLLSNSKHEVMENYFYYNMLSLLSIFKPTPDPTFCRT